jgi:hypothetical protein
MNDGRTVIGAVRHIDDHLRGPDTQLDRLAGDNPQRVEHAMRIAGRLARLQHIP